MNKYNDEQLLHVMKSRRKIVNNNTLIGVYSINGKQLIDNKYTSIEYIGTCFKCKLVNDRSGIDRYQLYDFNGTPISRSCTCLLYHDGNILSILTSAIGMWVFDKNGKVVTFVKLRDIMALAEKDEITDIKEILINAYDKLCCF